MTDAVRSMSTPLAAELRRDLRRRTQRQSKRPRRGNRPSRNRQIRRPRPLPPRRPSRPRAEPTEAAPVSEQPRRSCGRAAEPELIEVWRPGRPEGQRPRGPSASAARRAATSRAAPAAARAASRRERRAGVREGVARRPPRCRSRRSPPRRGRAKPWRRRDDRGAIASSGWRAIGGDRPLRGRRVRIIPTSQRDERAVAGRIVATVERRAATARSRPELRAKYIKGRDGREVPAAGAARPEQPDPELAVRQTRGAEGAARGSTRSANPGVDATLGSAAHRQVALACSGGAHPHRRRRACRIPAMFGSTSQRIDAASRTVRAGDVVTVALDRTVRVLKVAGFSERRGRPTMPRCSTRT